MTKDGVRVNLSNLSDSESEYKCLPVIELDSNGRGSIVVQTGDLGEVKFALFMSSKSKCSCDSKIIACNFMEEVDDSIPIKRTRVDVEVYLNSNEEIIFSIKRRKNYPKLELV